MKKIGVIFVNLILLCFVLCFVEFVIFKNCTKDIEKKPHYSLEKSDFNLEQMKKYSYMRKPCGLNYKKKPILIYGCSVAYGYKLKDEDSFGYQLSEYTKRPVYNFGMPAKGMQHAIYLLKNNEKISQEPEYVFYVFINDHYRRMFVNCNRIDNMKYLTYEAKNGILVEKKNGLALSERFYILSSLKNQMYYFLKGIFKKQIYQLAKLHLVTMKDEVKKLYPNAKFVVLDYEVGYYNVLSPEIIKDLNKSGIEVVSLNKEFSDKLSMDMYRNPKNEDVFRHPNGKGWSLVVKFIADKYHL